MQALQTGAARQRQRTEAVLQRQPTEVAVQQRRTEVAQRARLEIAVQRPQEPVLRPRTGTTATIDLLIVVHEVHRPTVLPVIAVHRAGGIVRMPVRVVE